MKYSPNNVVIQLIVEPAVHGMYDFQHSVPVMKAPTMLSLKFKICAVAFESPLEATAGIQNR